MPEKVIVESKIKSLSELRVSHDFVNVLNEKVLTLIKDLIKEAEQKAKTNKRVTILARDL